MSNQAPSMAQQHLDVLRDIQATLRLLALLQLGAEPKAIGLTFQNLEQALREIKARAP